ncbi:MAG: hypothetical protein AAEC10_02780, partial [Rhodospirillales bacterium]
GSERLNAPNNRSGADAEIMDGVEGTSSRLVRAAGDHTSNDIDHGVARQAEGGARGQRTAFGHPRRQGSRDTHALFPMPFILLRLI